MTGIFRQISAGCALLVLTGCTLWGTQQPAENEQAGDNPVAEQARQAGPTPELPDAELDGEPPFTLLSC